MTMHANDENANENFSGEVFSTKENCGKANGTQRMMYVVVRASRTTLTTF